MTVDAQWIDRIARGRFDAEPLDIATAEALVRHKLALAAAATMTTGANSTAAHRVLIKERNRRLMEMMATVAATKQVSALLSKAGIDHLHLKGPALAVQTTGNWRGRSSCDVDLLIDPADYGRTHRAFLAAGLGRRDGPRTPAGRLFRWATCEVGYDGTHANIDLHWRLDPSPALHNASFAQLRARAETVEIEGTEVRTLSRLDAWLFTAIHGARSDWTHWSMLLDAYRQLDGLTGMERRQARELAKSVGCAVPLAVAEALMLRCRPDWTDLPTEPWALRRADRIIAETRDGQDPAVNFRAALTRRLELGRAVPGIRGPVSSIGRALGRVMLRPGHYRRHFQATLASHANRDDDQPFAEDKLIENICR